TRTAEWPSPSTLRALSCHSARAEASRTLIPKRNGFMSPRRAGSRQLSRPIILPNTVAVVQFMPGYHVDQGADAYTIFGGDAPPNVDLFLKTFKQRHGCHADSHVLFQNGFEIPCVGTRDGDVRIL